LQDALLLLHAVRELFAVVAAVPGVAAADAVTFARGRRFPVFLLNASG
jgi:hypothetical protein